VLFVIKKAFKVSQSLSVPSISSCCTLKAIKLEKNQLQCTNNRVFPRTLQPVGRNVWDLDLNTLSCGMNEENDQQEITSTDSNILTESGGSEMLLFRNPMDDDLWQVS